MKDEMDNKWFQLYLDGDLDASEEREALHRIADDPELRALMKLEHILYQGLGLEKMGSPEVPAGFTDRVMNTIQESTVSETPQKSLVMQQISQWFDRLFNPQWIQWKPAYTMAMATLVILMIIVPPFFYKNINGQLTPLQTYSNYQKVAEHTSSIVWMRFVYVDNDAQTVSVAGDFNDWKPIQMTKSTENGQIVWSITIPLPHKEIHYMFVRNGDNWIPDPLAPREENDGFGHRNSVISL